jgi:hypothetical protein
MGGADTPSREFEMARKAYLAMLRRELDLKGMPEAYPAVEERLRLTPRKEEAARVGTLVTMDVHQLVTNYRRRKNGVTGEVISWYIDFLAEDDSRSMSVADARALAESVARPPQDARIVMDGYEIQGGRTYYRARWLHFAHGLWVEGDYIDVMINTRAARAFSLGRVWRMPHLSEEVIER